MKILIAEDESVSRRVLKMTLESWGHVVVEACDGAAAWRFLQGADAPRLAILDLAMPEMDGITVCRRVRQQATPVYIILLTAHSGKRDMVVGLEAGADDYLTKPFDRDELHARVGVGIRIIELQRNLAQRVAELEQVLGELRQAQETLRTLSLTDDLTGLYNRRGFFTLAEQHLKTARREKKDVSLIYADMDGLKVINDTHGHEEGSSALRKVSDILRTTFRSSDIIARIGGDEFVVFETSAGHNHAPTSVARLQENLSRHNAERAQPYELSLSIGIVQSSLDDYSTVEALLARGDELMYEEKRNRRRQRDLLMPSA
ncbi:MAG TPA: diguanylate cyclase [Pyrinomonadaceae bacterium]|nr:diguanylate cyclase [Pyrinomonadaceae bacterium]